MMNGGGKIPLKIFFCNFAPLFQFYYYGCNKSHLRNRYF